MKATIFACALILCAAGLRAQDIDSTALLFDDSFVHEFNIRFYYPDWEDSLKYWYEHGEEYIPARIEYAGIVFDSVGVRYKGNSSYNMSRNTPKKPLKFAFDKYRSKQECYDVETLNFSNATKDPTFLREKICYDMIAPRMHAPRAAFAAIKVDGALLGLYTMVEQVDKKFLARHFADNGFNLYKAADNGASLEYRGDLADPYRAEYELKTNEKTDDWTRFITMLNRLSSVPDAQFRDQVGAWIEFESAVQLLAFNMVMSNFDSYTGSGRNFYVYDDESTGSSPSFRGTSTRASAPIPTTGTCSPRTCSTSAISRGVPSTAASSATTCCARATSGRLRASSPARRMKTASPRRSRAGSRCSIPGCRPIRTSCTPISSSSTTCTPM